MKDAIFHKYKFLKFRLCPRSQRFHFYFAAFFAFFFQNFSSKYSSDSLKHGNPQC